MASVQRPVGGFDKSRPEVATEDPGTSAMSSSRFLSGRKGATGGHSVYMDGLHTLPPRVSILPRFLLRNFGPAETHSVVDAPVADGQERWPVVVFSPGYGAPRSFYASLIIRLASRGVVVLAMDHYMRPGSRSWRMAAWSAR
jgi:hypothetical protein